jgi:hypothetical protein
VRPITAETAEALLDALRPLRERDGRTSAHHGPAEHANTVITKKGLGVALARSSLLDQMFKRGHIDAAERRAGELFSVDFEGSIRAPGMIASVYKQGATCRMNLALDRLTPDELRAHHYDSFKGAVRKINHMPTIEALLRLVCDMPIKGGGQTAADVGRDFIDYRQQQQAQAVGITLIKVGLQKLAVYYGLATD